MTWLESLSVLGNIYFWLGVASSAALVVQIVLMCFSAFGGDIDLDGDGDIDVDTDSGVSIFTLKSITAFLAVGSWSGLLVYLSVKDGREWISVLVALVAGAIAMAVVVVLMRLILKLQCNGILQSDKLVGQTATVYVTVPAARSGRGKITLTAQGKFSEFDAITDSETGIAVDEMVEIVAVDNDCAVVKSKKQ